MSDEDLAPAGRERSPDHVPPEDDPMGPPKEPCECWCMHCERTFSSSGMWFQRVVGDPQGFSGFWMCPTPNCGGAGFTFDIFPTDPDHPANDGWVSFDDEDEDDEDRDGDDDDANDVEDDFCDAQGEADAEWDPDEPRWRALDEAWGGSENDDDDIEGEEWKYGLAPGERPPPLWPEEERLRWEAEQRSYDEPDRRPRELDWSDREPRRRPEPGEITDDDIPF